MKTKALMKRFLIDARLASKFAKRCDCKTEPTDPSRSRRATMRSLTLSHSACNCFAFLLHTAELNALAQSESAFAADILVIRMRLDAHAIPSRGSRSRKIGAYVSTSVTGLPSEINTGRLPTART